MDEAHVLILVIGSLLVLIFIAAVWAKLLRDTDPASGRHTLPEHVVQPVIFLGYGESARATWAWLNDHGFPASPLGQTVAERVLRWFGDDAPPLATMPNLGLKTHSGRYLTLIQTIP
ncbi:hypothetical protein FRC00_007918 [Tulasnella sp. 408]|nr:hypothetical protein FRC00_007918 [Tulasnella sp. 408]